MPFDAALQTVDITRLTNVTPTALCHTVSVSACNGCNHRQYTHAVRLDYAATSMVGMAIITRLSQVPLDFKRNISP
jgi:hypothetical protein